MEKLFFVHGAWHNEFAWDKVRNLLEKKGYRTGAVTLAGNGPQEENPVSFEDIASSLEEALKREERVILIGHSSAGQVIQSAAPRVKEKISKIMFNNAWILPEGKSQFDLIDPNVTNGMVAAAESRENRTIPMDERFLRGILANEASETLQDELLQLLVPQPLALMTEKIKARSFADAGFSVSLLYCKNDISVPPGAFMGMFKALGENNPVEEIAGDHECLFTNPEAFTAGLLKLL